jgi:hypothetical protein
MAGLITGIILDRYPNGGGERLVAVALGDNAHRDGTHIYPSIAEIADRTKLSRRTVQLHMSKMVATGWLILTRKSTGRRGDTNEYRISPEWLVGGECVPPDGPVLRTNAKRPESWGANIAPHPEGLPQTWGAEIAPQQMAAWGAASDTMGCNLTHDGVKPITPKPSGTVKEPTPLPPGGGPSAFERLVAAYPRTRVDLHQAAEAWRKLEPDDELQRAIVDAALAQAGRPEWETEGGRYAPRLSKWLRTKRWLDPIIRTVVTSPPPPVPERNLSAEQRRANRDRARELASATRAAIAQRKVLA